MVGYHYFWTEVMKELQMEVSPNFESHLLNLDKRKVSKFIGEHSKRQKTKRKKREHEKLRTELDRRFKDVAKKLEYGSKIGCSGNDESPKPKQKQAITVCNHASYGYKAKKGTKQNEASGVCSMKNPPSSQSRRGGLTKRR